MDARRLTAQRKGLPAAVTRAARVQLARPCLMLHCESLVDLLLSDSRES
jgi:hypothetical protein